MQVAFCSSCNNLLSVNIDKYNKILYICNICDIEPIIIDNIVIKIDTFNKTINDININKNIIHDRSCLRTKNVKCNVCDNGKNEDYKEKIIYKYDSDILLTCFICTGCLSVIKNK